MPRGMSRRTSGRASRLSATGTCSSGTRYSPGSWPWNRSDESAPGAFASDVSLAAGLPLAEDTSDANAPGALSTLQFQRSEEHTSELQSRSDLVCRLLLEKKKINN